MISGMQLRFDFNDKGLKQFFKEFEDKFNDPYNALEKMRLIIQKDVKSHFDNEAGPQGRWVSRQRFYSHPILKKSGALQRGIRAKVIPKRTGADIEITPSAKTKKYAYVHNYGGGNFIPQRRYAWVSKEAREKIEKVWLSRMRRED